MKRAGLVAAIAASVALLGACTVGPDFKPQTVASPPQWGQWDGKSASDTELNQTHREADAAPVASRTVGGAIDTQWWDRFNDPELHSLMQRLAAQNLDLRAAAQRIDEAAKQRDIVRSQGLPHVSAQTNYQRQRVSPDGVSSLEVPAPGAPLEYNLYQDGLQASWQLDLFGRVRRGTEAAGAELQASVEARRGIALSLAGELARDYMQLRDAQADERIARDTLALAKRNAELVAQRQLNGTAATLDVARANAQAASIEATLPALANSQSRLINAIGLLLGEAPRALEAELTDAAAQPDVPPTVPVGLPANLLRQRPDIREAEARLHAATAQIGVATAEFYPDVSLTGNFNLEGLQFKNMFALPDRAFSVGPAVSLPLFQGGRLKGTLHLREAQQREAAIQFHKTVLVAWQEVDDAMTAYTRVQQQRSALSVAAREDERALAAARDQYTQGAADFLDVDAALASELESRRALVDNQMAVENALVQLYLSLGGGWQIADASGQSASK